ncbi:MAG TPA: GDSL-type esterase/lipase family protein [Chitinophagaceae bacterium]|nr:GDSL-type esterase/lipase family protein [Chitinophagaceae bacterium]
MYRNILLIVFCFFLVSCSSPKIKTENNTLSATDLDPYGRYIVNDKQELELVTSGVHFGFTFRGTQCKLFASNAYAGGHNYLQYVLDGVYQKRIKVVGNSQEPIILTAPNAGKHTIWIYKATEAHTGAVIIQKITGQNIVPLKKPTLALIEFIGNSITCAAAADASEVPCGSGQYHDQHNAYYAYGPRVARALNTEFILSGVSGAGIYRNWNSDGPAMPQLFEKADFQQNSSRNWDFKNYYPKIVSIALGTNDLSNGDGIKKRLPFDNAIFVNNYIKFVQLVKSKYPTSQVVLLSSPIVNGSGRITLQNCLTDVKHTIDSLFPSDKPVALYFFKPMQGRGCTGHPSVEDHEIMAQELIPFFKKLLQ